MRVFALATAAALAASVWAPAPAAAQARVDSIAKLCPDLTFGQVSEQLGELVQKYEFSTDPEVAEQQIAGLVCPSSVAAAEAPQPEAAEEPKSEATEASLVREASMPPPHHLPPAPLPHFRPPPPRMLPPQVSIQHLPPPPPGGYGRRRPPPSRAMASMGGYRERYHHYEEHYRSRGPRRLPLTSSVRGEPYCMAETDPERFAREFPAPHAACEIGPIPNKPCPGWVCHRR